MATTNTLLCLALRFAMRNSITDPSLEAALTDRLNITYRTAMTDNLRSLSHVDRATAADGTR